MGFDGLASFTPDGKRVTWTSNRANGQSQLFTGEWDHAAALQALGEAPKATESTNRAELFSTSADYRPQDILRHVQKLCSPEMEGRLTGTRGERLATQYVAAYLETLGILPAGERGRGGDQTWYQYFDFPSGTKLGPKNQLTSGEQEFELNQDWRPVTFSATGNFEPAPIVFAGYGIAAPKTEKYEEYDSYVHLDVKDKWVLVLRYLPEDISPEHRQHLQYYSTLRRKARLARDKGAKGIVFVSGPTSQVRQQLIALQGGSTRDETSIPVISVADKVAQAWLKSAGKDLETLQKSLDSGQPQMGIPLAKVKLKVRIDVQQNPWQGAQCDRQTTGG